jgi:O-antigen/teichoic acid export membrane protein
MLKKILGRLGGTRLNVAVSLVLKGCGAVLSLAFNWGIAKLYGPLGSGLYGITQTSIVILGCAAMGGLDYVMLRGVATDLKAGDQAHARSLVRTACKAGLASALVVSLLIFALHEPAAHWLGNAGMSTMLIVAAPAAFGLAAMRLSSFALRGGGNVILSQAMEGAITSSFTVAMILLVWLMPQLPPVWSIGVIYSLSLLGTGAIGFIAYARMRKSWPKGEKVALWPLYAMGLPTVGAVLTNQSTEWISLTATGAFHSAEAAGKLRVALQIMAISNLIVASFDGIIGPQVAAAWSVGDRARIARMSRQAILGTVGLTLPLFLVAGFFPDWILGLFSHDFRSAATALQIIAFGYFIALSGGPSGTILLMCGRERWSLAYSLAGTVVMLGLCAWLVPQYGVTGGAIAVSGTMIFRRLVAGLLVRFDLKIKIFA